MTDEKKTESRWIRKTVRMPEPEECGPNGRIIVWHRYNGAMIANIHQIQENQFMGWWMPYPEKPEGADAELLKDIHGPGDCGNIIRYPG